MPRLDPNNPARVRAKSARLACPRADAKTFKLLGKRIARGSFAPIRAPHVCSPDLRPARPQVVPGLVSAPMQVQWSFRFSFRGRSDTLPFPSPRHSRVKPFKNVTLGTTVETWGM